MFEKSTVEIAKKSKQEILNSVDKFWLLSSGVNQMFFDAKKICLISTARYMLIDQREEHTNEFPDDDRIYELKNGRTSVREGLIWTKKK